MKSYGKELILDLFECDTSVNNVGALNRYFYGLCDLIDMERAVDPITGENLAMYWTEDDPQLEAHLIGTTGVQFIRTSNVMVHTLTELETVYINLFSCKDFDSQAAVRFSAAFFAGRIQHSITLERG